MTTSLCETGEMGEEHFKRETEYSFVHKALQVRRCTTGRGLFATTDIAPEEVLVAWTGRIVTLDEVLSLPENEKDYTLQIHDILYLIPFAYEQREKADFVNHSCDPNGGMLGDSILVSMRKIKEGEEVTFDYSMTESDEDVMNFKCLCGTAKCRGMISGNDWKNPALWERYGNFFAPYLKRKIEQLRAKQG